MKKILLEIAQGKRKDILAVLLAPFLYFFSLLYGIIVRLTCFSYCRGILPGYKSKIKVISVGNITLGGTGKTPFVKYLAQALLESGKKVVVLSRGYGMDEVRFLEANLPGVKVVSGRDRIQKAKEIEKDYPCDVIILDDGFQHWRLKRDLDIVLLNSREYLGNRNLIPLGILREPAASLKRAGVIVLSKADMADGFGYGCGYRKPHPALPAGRHRPLAYRKPNHGLVADNLSLIKEELRGINPVALVLESRHQPQGLCIIEGKKLELSALRGKRVCLLSGIADPDSFAQTVIKLGAGIALDLRYPDHYNYKENDIADIVNKCRDKKVDTIVTTEKDLPRLPASPPGGPASPPGGPLAIREAGLTVLVLKIELKITENEKIFFERIHRILAG